MRKHWKTKALLGLASLFWLLLAGACHTQKNGGEIARLKAALQKSNNAIAKHIQQLYLPVNQIYLLRCESSSDLQPQVNPIVAQTDSFLAKIGSLSPEKKLSRKEFLQIRSFYQRTLQNYRQFAQSQRHWQVNGYKIVSGEYSEIPQPYFELAVLRMKNDILIAKSLLYDYVLFYSVCFFKPSSFLVVNAEPIGYDSNGQFALQLLSEIPLGFDNLRQSIEIDSVLHNGKKTSLRPEIQTDIPNFDRFGQLIFTNLPPGNYLVAGKVRLLRTPDYTGFRLNVPDKTAYQNTILLPFSHTFTIRKNEQ